MNDIDRPAQQASANQGDDLADSTLTARPVPGGAEQRSERIRDRLKGVFGIQTEWSIRRDVERMLKGERALTEFSSSQRFMLLNILRFSDLRVEDAMVPRVDIVAVDSASPLVDLLRAFRAAGHSRLPIYRETLDDPVGFIHIKDLLAFLAEKAIGLDGAAGDGPRTATLPEVDLSAAIGSAGLVRDLLYVPGSMRAIDLLVKMQASRVHMAIVIDEYGGTDGLVTIEDLVEQIVGDIEDEHDSQEGPLIRRAGETAFLADARAPIEDLEDLLGFTLTSGERDEDVDTLGGLLFSLIGRIPVRGEILRHPSGVEFEVLESDLRRIKRLRILLPSPDGRDAGRG